MYRILASVVCGLALAACQTGYRTTSPESLYSSNSDEALALQVPPDLTDVTEGEQFVLPGTSGGAITRNTLLPKLEAVRFVRSGSESWLEIKRSPEDVWPQLQAFLRSERYPIAKTEPVAGVMSSQWREIADSEGRSALKSLLGSDATVARVAFRLERDDTGTRLFARRQVAASEDAVVGPSDVWPTSSHDPENTSEMLVRLMVFLGLEEQRARGILNDASVSAVLDDATLETTASDIWLVVHKGYRPAFDSVNTALNKISKTELAVDKNVGSFQATVNGSLVSFRVTPVNISAARVTVQAATPLTREEQEAILNELRQQLV